MIRSGLTALAFLAIAFSGCLSDVEVSCEGTQHQVLFLAPNMELVEFVPSDDVVRLGGATEGFATSMWPFKSGDFTDSIVIDGPVTMSVWLKSNGAVSPVVTTSGDGYMAYNLFGSNQTLMPAGQLEAGPVVDPGTEIHHVTHTLAPPPGGFVLPAGYAISAMIASLVLQVDPQMGGHDLLVGPSYPSHVAFTYQCISAPPLMTGPPMRATVNLPGNAGLFTGAIPEYAGVNLETVSFTLEPDTRKLTIALRETLMDGVKDDMDLRLVDADGTTIWSANSPHENEVMVLWENNLRVLAPPGEYAIEIRSYSGTAYQGELSIRQDV